MQDAERVARLLEAIPPEVVPVMRLFDGQRSLGDVLEDSPFRVFDTLRTITRLLDMGIIRRKAIERPTTGFAGHLRRPRGEEWIRPTGESVTPRPPVTLPITDSPAPPAPEAAAEPAAEQRVGLFTRKRTLRRRSDLPAPPVHPPHPAAPQVAVEGVAPTRAAPSGLTSSVHGELRVPSRNPSAGPSVSDVPKVVIDFSVIEEAPPPAPGAAPASRGVLRSAEITSSTRSPAPPPGAPSAGPSICWTPG